MSFWRNMPHHRRTVIGGLFLGTAVTLVTLIILQGLRHRTGETEPELQP